jgi:hypothetical protein
VAGSRYGSHCQVRLGRGLDFRHLWVRFDQQCGNECSEQRERRQDVEGDLEAVG